VTLHKPVTLLLFVLLGTVAVASAQLRYVDSQGVHWRRSRSRRSTGRRRHGRSSRISTPWKAKTRRRERDARQSRPRRPRRMFGRGWNTSAQGL